MLLYENVCVYDAGFYFRKRKFFSFFTSGNSVFWPVILYKSDQKVKLFYRGKCVPKNREAPVTNSLFWVSLVLPWLWFRKRYCYT